MSTTPGPATNHPAPPGDPLEGILRAARVIAVVGLSPNPVRPSFSVARYLQAVGYRIVPVHPGVTEILGEPTYASLEAIPGRVDIVNVFRRTEFILGVVQSAIGIGARAVWLQEGITDPAAEQLARDAGLVVASDLCILKEHSRLFRR